MSTSLSPRPDRLTATVAAGPVHDADLWQGVVAMGLTGVLVPEAYGGLGLSLLDAALLQEVMGEYAVPVAFTASAVLAPLALTLAGSEAQKETWLPAIVDGSLQVAVGMHDPGGGRDGAGLHVHRVGDTDRPARHCDGVGGVHDPDPHRHRHTHR